VRTGQLEEVCDVRCQVDDKVKVRIGSREEVCDVRYMMRCR
jgi:hypothetical protein